MAEYTAIAVQTVNPGETVVFTAAPVPCRRGLINHMDGTGAFGLSGKYASQSCCCCGQNGTAQYLVDFKANVANPAGVTPGEIDLAIVLDGTTVPASVMRTTPTVAEAYFNVGTSNAVDVWSGCCQTIGIRNTGPDPILVQDAVIRINRPDLIMTR